MRFLIHKISNVTWLVTSYQSNKREYERRIIINWIKVTIYSQLWSVHKSNYGSKDRPRWKRNTQIDQRSRQASEKEQVGLGCASAEFQVDDKARMTCTQCRGKDAFPIGDEFLIARARIGPNTMSRRQSISCCRNQISVTLLNLSDSVGGCSDHWLRRKSHS